MPFLGGEAWIYKAARFQMVTPALVAVRGGSLAAPFPFPAFPEFRQITFTLVAMEPSQANASRAGCFGEFLCEW